MADWPPIETAPRDGTKIILAAWSAPDDRWVCWQDYWRKYLPPYGEGFGYTARVATHWMPLPEPPADHA